MKWKSLSGMLHGQHMIGNKAKLASSKGPCKHNESGRQENVETDFGYS